MKLLDLPSDIISILPQYLHSIYDLYSVLLTCRPLYKAYRDIDVKLPPVLPRPDGQLLFQPHPHLLLTSLARQIGDWAVSSRPNRHEFYQVLLTGYDGLLSLAERATRVSLVDMQKLHETKYFLLNPLARIVDFEAGPAMVRNQDGDPDEYGLTICLQPHLAVLNYVIYCELFHHYVDDILNASAALNHGSDPAFAQRSVSNSIEAGIRHRFMAYCLPDSNNHRNRDYQTLRENGERGQWQHLDYLQMSQCNTMCRRNETLRRYWESGTLQVVTEDENFGRVGFSWDWNPTMEEKRERLFVTVATHLGWKSLKMLSLDGLTSDDVRSRLAEIRTRLQAIPKEIIDRWEYWDNQDEDESNIPPESHQYNRHWLKWIGLASDCHEGIGTSGETDEDLRTEERLCEDSLSW